MALDLDTHHIAVHLNVYKTENSHSLTERPCIKLCEVPLYEIDGGDITCQRWLEWKSDIDSIIVKPVLDKLRASVDITGHAPPSLYCYLGSCLNRVQAVVWDEGIPYTPKSTTTQKELLEIRRISHDGKPCNSEQPGVVAIIVTLDGDCRLSTADVHHVAKSIKKTQESFNGITKAFMICPQKGERVTLASAGIDTILTQISLLFKQCIREVDKDTYTGLAVGCFAPGPVAFFTGTLIHPHIHGNTWYIDYNNKNYTAVFESTQGYT